VVDGVFHWRAYSLTSEPGRPDGLISITPKLVDNGKVSPYLVKRARPGDVLRLGGVEGSFVMPDPTPEKALFLSAGSGITPIMSMLRDIDRRRAATDCVHVHSSRTAEGVIFGEQLERLEARNDRYQVTLRLTGEEKRIKPKDLDDLCPDWREREAFLSGPGDLLDAMAEHWEREGDSDLLHMERFQPKLALHDEGEGGRITFAASGCETRAEGGKPILVAGEEAGLDLKFGCREGICHTCIGKLCSGQVRDLRNGKVYGRDGEMVRICISAPEGDVEIDL
jgi:ferredoxin-NADP reductase